MYMHNNYLFELLLEWGVFQKKVVEKIKTHVLCSIMFSWKTYRLWDDVAKYGRPDKPQTKTQNGALAFMLVVYVYKNMLILRKTHCFFHCNNDYTKRFSVKVVRTLPVSFIK